MITVKQHEKLIDKIKNLSELELTAFAEELAEHVRKNNLMHVMESSFDLDGLSDRVNELEEENHELKSERDSYKRTIDQIKNII